MGVERETASSPTLSADPYYYHSLFLFYFIFYFLCAGLWRRLHNAHTHVGGGTLHIIRVKSCYFYIYYKLRRESNPPLMLLNWKPVEWPRRGILNVHTHTHIIWMLYMTEVLSSLRVSCTAYYIYTVHIQLTLYNNIETASRLPVTFAGWPLQKPIGFRQSTFLDSAANVSVLSRRILWRVLVI